MVAQPFTSVPFCYFAPRLWWLPTFYSFTYCDLCGFHTEWLQEDPIFLFMPLLMAQYPAPRKGPAYPVSIVYIFVAWRQVLWEVRLWLKRESFFLSIWEGAHSTLSCYHLRPQKACVHDINNASTVPTHSETPPMLCGGKNSFLFHQAFLQLY